MKIFRYSFRLYLVYIVIMLVFLLEENFLPKIQIYFCMLIIMIISFIFVILNLLITKIIIDDNGITFKNLYENKTLSWNDINSIVKTSTTGITLDAPKKMIISTWIKDYDLLLKLIVDNVANNDKIIIDLEIWKIIQQK